jgi:hypothetical protein
MNEEIDSENKEFRTKQNQQTDIYCLAFHIRYMSDIYINPKINLPESVMPEWEKFNGLLKKYNFNNEVFINQTIQNYNSTINDQIKKNAINKVVLGARTILIVFSI